MHDGTIEDSESYGIGHLNSAVILEHWSRDTGFHFNKMDKSIPEALKH